MVKWSDSLLCFVCYVLSSELWSCLVVIRRVSGHTEVTGLMVGAWCVYWCDLEFEGYAKLK